MKVATSVLALSVLIPASSALQKCIDETSKGFCYEGDAYLKHEPPKIPTIVNLIVTLNQVLDVNEEKHTVELMVQVTSKWQDDRLKLPGLDQIQTKFNLEHHLNEIWVAELFFSNSIKVETDEKLTSLEYAYWPSSANKNSFLYTRLVKVQVSCAMDFESFPFDSQLCIWNLRNLHGRINQVKLNPPKIYSGPNNTETLVDQPPASLNTTIAAFDIQIRPLKSSQEIFRNHEYSQARIEIQMTRKLSGTFKLIGSFFLPTLLYSSLSLFSFAIQPETVPGRMGMLVTLFLIVTNVYSSVDAPSKRGFSYIEKWYLCVLSPIVLALVEYAIILSIAKFRGGFQGPFINKTLKFERIIVHVDILSFLFCLTIIIAFNLYYWPHLK